MVSIVCGKDISIRIFSAFSDLPQRGYDCGNNHRARQQGNDVRDSGTFHDVCHAARPAREGSAVPSGLESTSGGKGVEGTARCPRSGCDDRMGQ